jgi:hypothetical protein
MNSSTSSGLTATPITYFSPGFLVGKGSFDLAASSPLSDSLIRDNYPLWNPTKRKSFGGAPAVRNSRLLQVEFEPMLSTGCGSQKI